MNRQLHSKDLTTGVVWKRLLVFFLPIAAGTCIQQLYNAVDGLIVGRFVGTVALAAVGGSSAQIINLLIGFFVATTAGASVVIAQIYGAGRTEDVRVAAGNALAVFALLGLFLTGLGLLASPWMLRVLRTPADTLPGSILYLRIYFLGVPFVLVLNMESNMLRSVGDSLSPFLYMVAGCITNIILDVVFVVFFHWGIAGVAIATVAAQIVNMLLLTRKLMRTKESYRLSLRELKLKGVYLANMFRLGLPSGLQNAMYGVSNMIIQIGVNSLGTVVVASWAMTSKTDGIFWAVSNALGAAITSFIGQNLGARKTDRVKLCVRQGMTLAFLITISLSALIMLLAKPLLRLLTTDQAVIATTYEMMTYFVPFYFAWTVIEVLTAVLRGAGDAVRPVIIIGLGICLFRILWIITLFRWFHTLPVLCLTYVASWTLTSIIILIYFRKANWMDRSRTILDR
ncbi:MAG: MATE family efflux transporter [Oscillospiraceae bacterium]|nr:MATE family efflux transporter [Oscillospiraceae bacterium]